MLQFNITVKRWDKNNVCTKKDILPVQGMQSTGEIQNWQ